ncbi:MAG: hypothetical protein Q8P11_03570 [bacterium]|nr:hypothetical protein [bacterium]
MYLPLRIDFSETESYPQNSTRITFWGDSSEPNWGEDECMANQQTVTISLGFTRPKKYDDIVTLIASLSALMQADGWSFSHEDVGPLVDTNDREFWGTPENDFPRSPSWGGWNASRGFTLDFEKEGTKPTFTEVEIASVQKLIENFAENVFERRIPESAGFKKWNGSH